MKGAFRLRSAGAEPGSRDDRRPTSSRCVAGGAFFFRRHRRPAALSRHLTRLHALTKADNLGLGLVVIGLLPRPEACRGLKLILVWLLVLLGDGVADDRARGAAAGQADESKRDRARCLLLALALWTLVARDTFAAVGFVPLRTAAHVVWLRLRGRRGDDRGRDRCRPDRRVLIGAASRLRRTEAGPGGPGLRARARGHIGRVVAAALAVAILLLPDPAPTLAPAVAQHRLDRGRQSDHRGAALLPRDGHLLEAVVLLFALVGVWSLAPDRAWGGRPGPRRPADPNGILAYFARVLPPIGIVVAIYILWVGADHPGGKFQGARCWPRCGCW